MRTTRTTNWSLLTALLPAALFAACGNDSETSVADEAVVNVYNWADYIAPDTIEKFEAEYGIKVNYDLYDAAGAVDVKLLTGNSGYDVVSHSNQYASRLVPIGIFEKLDMSKIPNARFLDPDLMRKISVYKIVKGYTMPYHWGTTGFAWNVDLVRERLPNHPMDSADIIFDPAIAAKLADCGISLLDGPNDVVGMALNYLGYSPSSTDLDEITEAQNLLISVRPYIRYFSNDKMTADLPNKEVCIAHSWSGDYVRAADRAVEAGIDIDLQYMVPKEGAALFVDGLYIPSDAPHKENAYLFLDFMTRPDIAAANAISIGYANANRGSWEFMPQAMLGNPSIYPGAEVWDRLYIVEVFDPKSIRPRTRAFSRAKSGL